MRTCKGRVNAVESFGSVDGPGLRYIFFLQGCPLRCQYCHNPETWPGTGGMEMTADEALRKAMRYKSYWKNGGGITVSGGEPLLQAEFVTALFTLAKEQGISTCIDTSGAVFSREEPVFSRLTALLAVTDTVLLDIKHIDMSKHRDLTGQDNTQILDFAKYLAEIHKPVWIRHVLVPGITDDEESLAQLSAFVAGLGNVQRFEVLPYHRLAVHKYEELGIDYPLVDVPEPTKEMAARAEEILRVKEYQGYKR
ncbi:pyruvate formate-lyase-activating protein [Selenomonas sp.]|uniref:pyruvate formate-lyase-activating protein n=1 Tax=Selenomonas sp. TaxID=2053611 RepID=UPI0025FFDFE9|nr:pyruvate formate-lyase-activating protein [Selenomonas sp.]MBQ1868418.1 pyruvate formate lyase-activating protein [Selenomonas sp.]